MNTTVKEASKDYNKRNFEVKDGHIQFISIIWERGDIEETAEHMTFNNEQVV